MKVEIHRTYHSGDATIGKMSVNGIYLCRTLEPEWMENKGSISCIPEGDYHCVIVVSPKFGITFCVSGVNGRDHILFHAGNTRKDTHGCILLGMEIGFIDGERAVLKSKEAMFDFMDKMAGLQGFDLTIGEAK